MSGNNHAMDEDDVDDFLYGSDASENNYGTTSKSANKKNIEEDEEIYQQYNEDMANRASTKSETPMKESVDVVEQDEAMEEDQQDEEDSDDDLDIILEADDDDHSVDGQHPSSPKSQDVSNGLTKSGDALVNIKLGQQGKDGSQGNDTTKKSSTANGQKPSGGVDVEKVGEYNGQPITDVDLDIFEDKPWRKPGADITDYFNFGFNELSWKAYCAKQKNMRDKKANGKDDMPMPDFMAGMADMPDFMKMGMMMPMMEGDMPMGMMEGGMPMGMMNPMMNPMMGMPPPPPPPHRHQQMNGPSMGGPNRGGPPMGGSSMGGPSMGSSPMGNSSSRPTGSHGDRGGQGNQNYGGSGGHGHSYSRGQRR